MKDLIKEHKPFVKVIKNMQRKINDSEENPLLDDGNIYKDCDLKKPKKLKDKMNVLIIVFDSVSFNQFKRIFPLTFKYLQDLKDNMIFENYNAVAENSYPNFLSFLTGLHETENPELNLSIENILEYDEFEDLNPLIWKDYEKEDYLTLYSEDYASIGLFNYAHKGMHLQLEN